VSAMPSGAATAGILAVVGIGAGITAWYLTRPSTPGCPAGDVAETNGVCPEGYSVDPNAAGCCEPTTCSCPSGDVCIGTGESCPPGYEPDPVDPSECCKPIPPPSSVTLVVTNPSAMAWDFKYSGATDGGEVYLILNTVPNNTSGTCENLNGLGCIGTASIWNSDTANSNGAGVFNESDIPTDYYWAVYDADSNRLSNWVQVVVL
jgi:hypothetical protein